MERRLAENAGRSDESTGVPSVDMGNAVLDHTAGIITDEQYDERYRDADQRMRDERGDDGPADRKDPRHGDYDGTPG